MQWWIDSVKQVLQGDGRGVLVTIVSARGSTPRGAGTRMLVTAHRIAGTIGGGRLEFAAMESARRILNEEGTPKPRLEKFALGPTLAQCCGGSVTLHFEFLNQGEADWIDELLRAVSTGEPAVLLTTIKGDPVLPRVLGPDGATQSKPSPRLSRGIDRLLNSKNNSYDLLSLEDGTRLLVEVVVDRRAPLLLFGAGHVGQAIVRVFTDLPFRVSWIDSRSGLFPSASPENVICRHVPDPIACVAEADRGAYFLVMTHSHPLDLALCEAVLRRGDFAFLGLIGSSSKRQRFRRQLLDAGLNKATVDRMISPIGIDTINGKSPAEIAVATAAQLLQWRQQLEAGQNCA